MQLCSCGEAQMLPHIKNASNQILVKKMMGTTKSVLPGTYQRFTVENLKPTRMWAAKYLM